MTTETTATTKRLPVVIAGAGPCGLVAAITLQQENVPFVVVERASRDRLCSNVGSSYDLANTALDILQNRLKVPNMNKGFVSYGGVCMFDMMGTKLRDFTVSAMKASSPRPIANDVDAKSANRTAMQECFLTFLIENEKRKKDDFDESTVLICGVEVVGYEENDEADSVTIKLSNGTNIVGSALLGCDGIHSVVRRCMMSSLPEPVKDELHFCNIVCWWGKVVVKPGTQLHAALEATQIHKEDGASFIMTLGSGKHPGSFMGAPIGDTFMWVFLAKSSEEPERKSDDLTRRGGETLNEDAKNLLKSMVEGRSDLIYLTVKETPASGITKVGLFDRENLELPYSRGRVALLGDAAHPQSPMMGQGCNQAMTDAYVCSMRLSRQPVRDAFNAYDSDARRRAVNAVIKQARSVGNMTCATNRFVCWLYALLATRMPLSWMTKDDPDTVNADFVHELDNDLVSFDATNRHDYSQNEKRSKSGIYS